MSATDRLFYSDEKLSRILRATNIIAMVGASPKPDRPSHEVMRYLQSRGFHVIPVNPQIAGARLLGELAYASLRDVPDPVDLVDIFRDSRFVAPIVADAIAVGARTIWMQLGVRDAAAAARAQSAGLEVVMDRCPKIEIERLGLRRP